MASEQDDQLDQVEAALQTLEGSRQLILAVLRQAIWDASQPNWARALDALAFFFECRAQYYTDLLGLDYEKFLVELIETGRDSSCFMANYERWLNGFRD